MGFTVLEGEHAPVGDQIEAVVRLNGRWQEDTLPVFGLFGGGAGRGGGLWLNGQEVDHGVRRRLRAGDSVRFQLMGGGGYGDPFERDADRVEADVRTGLVSVEAARADYGVVIDSGTNTVDRDASDEVRRTARQAGKRSAGRLGGPSAARSRSPPCVREIRVREIRVREIRVRGNPGNPGSA